MRALIALLVLVAGCSAASEARSAGQRRAVAVTTTTTVPPVVAPTTAPRPTDEVGLRCQRAVDDVLAELVARGKAPPEADGVCRTREQEPILGVHTGYSIGTRFVVRYPFDRVPESQWDQTWRDVAAHEIGHTWSRRLSAAQQQSYAAIRGQVAWSPEDFADVYAAVVGHAGFLGYIETPPPADQVEALCAAGLLPC